MQNEAQKWLKIKRTFPVKVGPFVARDSPFFHSFRHSPPIEMVELYLNILSGTTRA